MNIQQQNTELAIVNGLVEYCHQQAQTININPLYLMLPVTVSSSFAFMLPVATPPNAIVFAYGNMKIMDMVCVHSFQFISMS